MFNKYIIDNVYFRHNISVRMVDKGEIKTSNGSITIPMEFAELGGLDVNQLLSCDTKNSYVVNGAVEDTSYVAGTTYNELVKNYNLFKILSVADNRKGGLQHIKIEVEA